MKKIFAIRSLNFKLLSTVDVENSSSGEITNQHTLDPENKMPASKGLICQEIFGTYLQDDRKLNSGHISFPFEIINPLFYYNKEAILNGIKYLIGMDLNSNFKEKGIMKVAHYKAYYVLEATEDVKQIIQVGALLTRDEYFDYKKQLGENAFSAISGFELFKYAINNLDIEACIERLQDSNNETAIRSLRYIAYNKDVVNSMFTSAITVLPAGMREILIGDSELRLAHIHTLYRRIILAKSKYLEVAESNDKEEKLIIFKVDLIKSIEKLYLNETQLKPVYAPDPRFVKDFNRLEFMCDDEKVKEKSNGEVDNYIEMDTSSLYSSDIFTEEGNGMGHIELAEEIFNPLYKTEIVAKVLNVSLNDLERILSGDGYLVVESNEPEEVGKVYAKSTIRGKKVEALGGLDAIKKLIEKVDPNAGLENIKKIPAENVNETYSTLMGIYEKMLSGNLNLNNLLTKVFPVLPLVLRKSDSPEVNPYLAESINERYKVLIDINQKILSGEINGENAFIELQNAANRLMSREGFLNTIMYPNKIFVLTSLLGHIKYLLNYNSYWFNEGYQLLSVVETVLNSLGNIEDINKTVENQVNGEVMKATEEEIIMFEKMIESLGFKVEIDSVESN